MRLMERYPFATLITQTESGPVINHLPLMIDVTGSMVKLIGHLSRHNPQLEHFQKGLQVTAVFHGPQTYITPRWYAEHDVPTWNYAVVHATGAARALESHKEVLNILRKLTGKFEPRTADPQGYWKFSLPEDLSSEKDLSAAIAGFEIELTHLEGKFKLGQNRSQADKTGVIRGLQARGDETSAQMLELMKEF